MTIHLAASDWLALLLQFMFLSLISISGAITTVPSLMPPHTAPDFQVPSSTSFTRLR